MNQKPLFLLIPILLAVITLQLFIQQINASSISESEVIASSQNTVVLEKNFQNRDFNTIREGGINTLDEDYDDEDTTEDELEDEEEEDLN